MSANLSNEFEKIATGNEAILIRRVGGRILGGRTLELSDYDGMDNTIKAGHIIIVGEDGKYRPLNVDGAGYHSKPSGAKYAGVLVRTITKNDARATIQYDGEINDLALPYSIDVEGIREAIKADLPSLYFMHD